MNSMAGVITEAPTFIALSIGGFAGSFFHLLGAEYQKWQEWLKRFIAGLLAAVGLGGIISVTINSGFWGAISAGFVCGAFTEFVVERVRENIRKNEK